MDYDAPAIVHALDALRSEIRALTFALLATKGSINAGETEVNYWQRDSDAAMAQAEAEAGSERDDRAT